MAIVDSDEFRNSYFVFGCIKEPVPPFLTEEIHSTSTKIKISQISKYGYYFYNLPGFVQVFETEEMVWIKLGHFHDSDRLLSMGRLLAMGWLILPASGWKSLKEMEFFSDLINTNQNYLFIGIYFLHQQFITH
jgi:hypothetical protein